MEAVGAMKVSAPIRTMRLPARDIPTAVANFKRDALPHYYSLGSTGKTRLAGVAIIAGMLNGFATVLTTLITAPIVFGLARWAGRNQEKASVNDLVRLIQVDGQNKDLLRQEMAGSKLQPRLSMLLEKRGVVI